MAKKTVGELLINLVMGTGEFDKSVKAIGRQLDQMGRQFTNAGKTLTAGITAPIVGFGAAAFMAGQKVDDALDTIRVGTGATGEALKKLEQSFKNVGKGVPNDLGQVADAIADLNTRTGLTGKALEDLATQELNLARITGGDLKTQIAATTRVFGDWSISSEKQSGALDYLYKVSQSTGIGIDRLGQQVVQFGAPLRQMGYSFEQSAAMIGKFEKEGVNMEVILGSMRIALTQLARAGVQDAAGALKQVQEQIKNAGSAAEANAIALKVFGAKAGPDMAAAIREGRFEIGALVDDLQRSGETINKAAEETKDFAERWDQAKNKITLALEPLGTKLMDVFDKTLIPLLEKAIYKLEGLAEAFSKLSPSTQTAIIGIAGAAAAIGPLLWGLGTLMSSVKTLVPALTGAKNAFLALKGAMLGTAEASLAAKLGILGIAAAVMGFSMKSMLDELREFTDLPIEKKSETFRGMWSNITAVLAGPIGAIGKLIEGFKLLGAFVEKWSAEGFMAALKALDSSASASANTLTTSLAPALASAHGAAQGLTPAMASAHGAVTGLGNAAPPAGEKTDQLGNILDKLGGKAKGAKDEVDKLRKAWEDEWQKKAAEETKTHQQALESVREEMERTLRPADQLAEKLRLAIKDGWSQDDIIRVYGRQVIEAARAQQSMNRELDGFTQSMRAAAIQAEIMGMEPLPMATNAIERFGLATSVYGTDEIEKLTKATHGNIGKTQEWGGVWGQQVSTLVTDLGKGLSDAILKWKDFGSTMIDIAKQFLGSIIRMFTETFAGGLMKGIMGLFSGKGFGGFSLGNLFGGLFGGGKGNATGVLAEFGGTKGLATALGVGGTSLFAAGGIGGSLAAMPIAPTMLSGMGLAGSASGLGGTVGGIGSAGGGGLMASLGALFTNPWTAAIGGGLAGGITLYKLFHDTSWEKGAKETGKHLGTQITDDIIKQFVAGLGLSEKQFKGIRQDIITSPKFLQDLAIPQALASGQIDALLEKSKSIGAFGKFYDFSASLKKALEGDWTEYNKQWRDLFAQSKALTQVLPDWEDKLLASGEAVMSFIESLGEADKLVREGGGSERTGGAREGGATSRTAGEITPRAAGYAYSKLTPEEISRWDPSDMVPGIGGGWYSRSRMIETVLPTLHTGGTIQETGVAVVERGERVIPEGAGGGVNVNITQQPASIEIHINVTGIENERDVREKIIPPILDALETNNRGAMKRLKESLQRAGIALATT